MYHKPEDWSDFASMIDQLKADLSKLEASTARLEHCSQAELLGTNGDPGFSFQAAISRALVMGFRIAVHYLEKDDEKRTS